MLGIVALMAAGSAPAVPAALETSPKAGGCAIGVVGACAFTCTFLDFVRVTVVGVDAHGSASCGGESASCHTTSADLSFACTQGSGARVSGLVDIGLCSVVGLTVGIAVCTAAPAQIIEP